MREMALEALSSNELLNFIIYDTISATPSSSHDPLEPSGLLLDDDDDVLKKKRPQGHGTALTNGCSFMPKQSRSLRQDHGLSRRQNLSVQPKKKRRRKPRVCKNKEEAEAQRMTHIAVERNRRKQMNEYLSVLRSLMPESYVQRGDQASIVGGAIEFVKELEHLSQSLEAQKLQLQQRLGAGVDEAEATIASTLPPFNRFFAYPQYTWSQLPHKFTTKTKAAIADIEVTLIESYANLRILCRKLPRQLSKLVAGFQTLYLTILHINVTSMDPLVLYSISAKVEEGCQFTSVDDIAAAVHHILIMVEEEAALC